MPPKRQREDRDVSLIPSWCEELRAARLARDWSEDDLADQIQNWEYRHGAGRHLGVSRSYVSEWETGKRGVSRDYAIRIEGDRYPAGPLHRPSLFPWPRGTSTRGRGGPPLDR
jgi:transcriptional regulator with XRE-family HTH domain